MPLDLLPTRTDSAATNMATDFLLLQHYPAHAHARFRHYGWQRAAFTFGYSQKLAWVRDQLPEDAREDCELCRRPTGGGVVDHRTDWTYALVIPRGHDLYDARAAASYEAIHRLVARCLQDQGVNAMVKETCDFDDRGPCEEKPTGPGVCFEQPERFDVMLADTRIKIAGAAQKRAKRGLLFQGSVARDAAGDSMDWDRFAADFTVGLDALLHLCAQSESWPENWDENVDSLAEVYADPQWNERR
jgi:lipoate-protein ligase A